MYDDPILKFGPYDPVQEISSTPEKTIYKVRDQNGEFFAAKAFLFPKHIDKRGMDQLQKYFYKSIELQKQLGEESKFVAPVLLFGSDRSSAWYITKLYPASLETALATRSSFTEEEIFELFDTIAKGTLEFKISHGRPHGNLKTTNVLLTEDGKTKFGNLLLTDPAPGDGAASERHEIHDTHALGVILYRLVHPREQKHENEWKINTAQPGHEWVAVFGKHAKQWAVLCARLLETRATRNGYTLERVALELLKLQPKKRGVSPMVLAGAGAAVVVVVLGIVVAIVATRPRSASAIETKAEVPPPAPIVIRETDPAQQAEIRRQAEALRVAQEKAAAAAKASTEARNKADAELKRLAEEKRIAEERAQKAIEEARNNAELAEQARLKAAQDFEKAQREAAQNQATEVAKAKALAAELEKREQEAREAAQRAEKLRRDAEIRRMAEEDKARALALELKKQTAAAPPVVAAAPTAAPVASRPAAEPVPAAVPVVRAKAGQRWSNSLGMKFVPLSGGKALVSAWETRVGDFEKFVSESGIAVDGPWKNPTFKQSEFHPVVSVSLKDAEAFCAWLTQTERAKGSIGDRDRFRIPSASEWTSALDSKQQQVYVWGAAWPPPSGCGNFSTSFSYDHFTYTAPVAQFGRNDFGIFDLGGNVWELCREGATATARGGAWSSSSSEQVAYNYQMPMGATDRRNDVGFRCVLELAGN